MYRVDVGWSAVLHLLQLAVRLGAGGRVLGVRGPQVCVPAHHDHERHGHVLLPGTAGIE